MEELSQSIQDDIRAAEPGWCSAFVECCECGYKWVAVYPVECDPSQFETPCQHGNGAREVGQR